jgi:hypothetical protein
MALDTIDLNPDETALLDEARRAGRVSVALYEGGVFSEPDFIRYGVLERLVIRKRVAFIGRSGDQKNAAYHYELAPAGAQVREAALDLAPPRRPDGARASGRGLPRVKDAAPDLAPQLEPVVAIEVANRAVAVGLEDPGPGLGRPRPHGGQDIVEEAAVHPKADHPAAHDEG